MRTIKIIEKTINRAELRKLAGEVFGDMVKGTADIKKERMALGGEMHIDSNTLLIESGSSQGDVWGFNIYPDLPLEEWIEYNSLVNIKPKLGNKSADILDESVRAKVREVVMEHIFHE